MIYKQMSSWVSRGTRINNKIKPQIYPTFHILIATGGRPELLNMLNSLKDQLSTSDAITIVFDGENAKNKSKMCDDWLIGHKAKINIIEQNPNLGFWGHEIRNKYQGILEPKTTFILNADDDDIYTPNTFTTLRTLCINPDTLYIAKFIVKRTGAIVPSQNYQIINMDIGTPCGIIPFNIASKSIWGLKYGGDFDYYNNLKQFCKHIKFLNLVIYEVN